MVDAPRFRMLWERIEDTSVLTMSREEWHTAVGTLGAPVTFDVRATPLSDITHVSSVVAAVAHQFGPATAQVSIFRHDPKDAPYSINHDEYDVWTDLSSHPRLHDMINLASTSDNENFRSYCKGNVFLAKRKPGPDHWMTTLPSSITALMKKTGS
jgi:hypothetical protein